VTEWNVSPFPVPDRHVMPLYVASAASLQGWRALMQYAYAKEGLNEAGIASNWQSYNDPGLLAMLPAAALLYRQQHVSEARTTYAFAPSAEQLFGEAISPDNSVALRTAAERVGPEDSGADLSFAAAPPWGELAMTPREAFLGAQQVLPADDAVGRIAAESLATYPPGIPNVLPGERLTAETLAYIRETLKLGGSVRGASDRLLHTVRVVAE